MDTRKMRQVGERRPSWLLWLGGATAATILVLGINGTLASWTQAIITNDTNTTKVTDSVALEETSGVLDCSTSSTADNTYVCSTINKYGGTTTPLDPDGVNSNTTTVTLKNVGTGTGDLTLKADACTKSGEGPNSTGNLCDEIEVEVECGGDVKYTGTLTAFASAAASPIATLAADQSISCDVTVTLPATAPAGIAGTIASQPMDWTLEV